MDTCVSRIRNLGHRLTPLVVALLIVGSTLVVGPGGASAAPNPVLVVNSTGDGSDASVADGICATAQGDCTLRAAIEQANFNFGPDLINFNIPGRGPHQIQIGSMLPRLEDTRGGTTIDGYSQPGSRPNTTRNGSNAVIKIELTGNSGVRLGFRIITAENVIRGLSITGFQLKIQIDGQEAVGNRIIGNFIGLDPSGHARASLGTTGVFLMLGASQNQIGTSEVADVNVIGGNGSRGILVEHQNTKKNRIQNNVIGLTPDLTAASNQTTGIDVQWYPTQNLIGGPGPNEGNILSGNNRACVLESWVGGIDLSHSSFNNYIIGNFMGTLADGNTAPDYARNCKGMLIKDNTNSNYVADNIIGNSIFDGITHRHNYSGPNTFVRNRIGVGLKGSDIGNGRYGILLNGHDINNYENIVANSGAAEIYVDDRTYNDSHTNFPPGQTTANPIHQSTFYNRNQAGGNVTVSQSGTSHNGQASRAVDGNRSGVFRDGSVTHTDNSVEPWWQADLGQVKAIDDVALYNRTDCCANRLSEFYVLVSQKPFGSANLTQLLADPNVSATYVEKATGVVTHVNVAARGRYLRIQKKGSGYVALAEVEISAREDNAKVAQSSTGWSASATRAYDGNRNSNFHQGSVSSTKNTAQPWWQVDLGANKELSEIRIYNRTDCCSTRLTNYYVLTSAVPFSNGATLDELRASRWVTAYRVSKTSDVTTLDLTANGDKPRYVRIQLVGTDYLSLAEVEIQQRLTSDPPYIDIEPSGPNPNDSGDRDKGAQNGLNHPEITGIGPGKIFGQACANCLVEVYTSGTIEPGGTINTGGTAAGTGMAWVGSTRADGSGAFSLASTAIVAGRMVSALAIDNRNDTSELPLGTLVPSSHTGTDGAASSSIGPAAFPARPDLPGPYEPNKAPTETVTMLKGTVVDRTGAGVAGVSIDRYTKGRVDWLDYATTGTDGSFAFNVEPGCYVLTYVLPRGKTFTNGSRWMNQRLCVEAQQVNSSGRAVVDQGGTSPTPGTISGSISSNGAPKAGVSVELYSAAADGSRANYLSYATSDAKGRFALKPPSAGCYVLTFVSPNSQTWTANSSLWYSQRVCIRDGQELNAITASLNP